MLCVFCVMNGKKHLPFSYQYRAISNNIKNIGNISTNSGLLEQFRHCEDFAQTFYASFSGFLVYLVYIYYFCVIVNTFRGRNEGFTFNFQSFQSIFFLITSEE